jgi:hypothetical protein
VVLALAVLCAISAAPDVAAHPELPALLPSLCRLLHNGSLAGTCRVTAAVVEHATNASAVEAAVVLAARLVTSNAGCSGADGRVLLLRCRAASALASWLQAHLASAPPDVLRAVMDAMLQAALVVCEPDFGGADGTDGRAQHEASSGGADVAQAEVVAVVAALAHAAGCDVNVMVLQPGATSNAAVASADAKARRSSLQALQWHALHSLAALLPEAAASSAGQQLAPHTSSSKAPGWQAGVTVAVLRVLKCRERVASGGLDAALAVTAAMAEIFGPLALLKVPREPTTLATIDASQATELVSVLAQVIKVETYSYLQALALASQPTPSSKASHSSGLTSTVPGGYSCSPREFELCIDLQAALLALLMTDALADFEGADTKDALSACSQAGLDLMAAALLSDEVTGVVRCCISSKLCFTLYL